MMKKISGACGIASQVVVLTALLVVIANSPWFSWTGNHISVLGVKGSVTALFNWGLILAGLLGVFFAIGLKKNLPFSRLNNLGVLSLILGSMALLAIGVFPRSIDLPHDIASISFFIFIIMALLFIGMAMITVPRKGWGLFSLTSGVLIIIFWLIPWSWDGGAIPQLLFCLPWSLWTIVFAVDLITKTEPFDVRRLA
ncbi:DUF998 domain-containing protein [Chloroflexota bacterium]